LPRRIALILLAIALVATPAAAQGIAAPPADGSSLWDQTVLWVLQQQHAFHRELADLLQRLSDGSAGFTAGWALIGVSFLYGLFHAAGPGHGKAVVASYLLTQPTRLQRGAGLAATAAFCQGVVAILLVNGLLLLGGRLLLPMGQAVDWSERLSFMLVGLLGAWLAVRSLRGAVGLLAVPKALAAGPAEVGHGDHHHHHHHHDVHCGPGCGHAHAPDPAAVAVADDWRTQAGIVLSIGLRPCSGAVLVLVLANSLGLAWAGMGAVAAMSAGTALATALLALLVVGARDRAVALAGARTSRLLPLAGTLVGLGGGLLLVALGLSLLLQSLAPAHPLMGM